ncbi:hypothetical protein [Cohnella yongneupensis]|uniref:Uncharacterized protein n=1 Tax=Cohnella yongneupensis TaxID=425006 RepID=A0ABW0QTZ4_9BACL
MAKPDWMKVIQVVFNITDPDQLRQYRHASSKSNQSGYIKRLIDRDMDRGEAGDVRPLAVTKKLIEDDFSPDGFI